LAFSEFKTLFLKGFAMIELASLGKRSAAGGLCWANAGIA
jgi:hypothetical protein